MIGKTVSHYKIIEKLGEGGMGAVYKVEDTKLKRTVALKFVSQELTKEPEAQRRLLREARAAAALNHNNICTIHEVGEVQAHDDLKLETGRPLPPGTPFIAMELIEGKPLNRVLSKSGPLPLDEFLDMAVQVAEGLAEAHAHGIVHRDLKPQNVVVTPKGLVKILDFGLAKPVFAADQMTSAETITAPLTHEGTLLGTAPYMSPEQAMGKAVDSRSDVFSFGVMLYEMAVGKRPFRGENSQEILAKILETEPTPLSEVKPDLPVELERITRRCLRKKPEERYNDTRDLVAALADLRRETTRRRMAPPAPPPRRSLLWPIVGGMVIAAAAAILVLPRVLRTELPADTDKRTMLAVLPFENLGAPEDEYFAAGITEEITFRLAKISGLGVISRTSAKKYKNTEKSLRQIGEELGVQYVLEGTIRYARLGDTERARITPQLIRVADDTHVWTDSFDRVLDDIFEVQSDIASSVIRELGVTLLGSERERLEERPTDNIEAYQAYLQAKELKLGTSSSLAEFDRKKVSLLEKATTLDPGFLASWFELALHHSGQYTNLDQTETRLARAKEAVERAEAVDLDHPFALLARGYYYYYGFRDYDRALIKFTAASEVLPNDTNVLEAIAYIYRRQGKLEQAVEDLENVTALDPENTRVIRNLAWTYHALRRFEPASRLLDRLLELEPENDGAALQKASILISWKGDVAGARSVLREKPGDDPISHFIGWWVQHTYERDHGKALEQAERIEASIPFIRAMKMSLVAPTEVRLKGADEASGSLAELVRACKEVLEDSPSNATVRGWLAGAYAHLGDHSAAVSEAKLAVQLEAQDLYTGPAQLRNLAYVYSLVGREKEAVEILDRLLVTNYNGAITVHELQLDPSWDTLRETPGFVALLEKYGEKLP